LSERGLLAIGAARQLAAFERLWRVLGIVMIDQAVLDKAAERYAALRVSGQLIADGLWCMNRGIANEINTLRFSALNRKT
jgi:hypothetical protein